MSIENFQSSQQRRPPSHRDFLKLTGTVMAGAPLDNVLTRNNITDLNSAHDAMHKDGNIYGLDMVTVAFGILYNKTRYEKAGSTPATTPDEWVEVTTALTDRDNQKYGLWANHLISEPSDFWFQLEEWCMPYDGIWADGKKPLLTSDPIINGLKALQADV